MTLSAWCDRSLLPHAKQAMGKPPPVVLVARGAAEARRVIRHLEWLTELWLFMTEGGGLAIFRQLDRLV
eukprot:7222996-Pyramimonas_sp.AAC.1